MDTDVNPPLSPRDRFANSPKLLIFRDSRLQVVEMEGKGRCYVAVDAIPAGTTILKERSFHKATTSSAHKIPTSAQFVDSLEARLKNHPEDIPLVSRLFPIYPNPTNACPTRQQLELAYQCNGFAFDGMGESEHGGALFLDASYINHSCEPNCFFFISQDTLHIRTTKYIAKNEELCITYLGGPEMDLYRTTQQRRLLLEDHYLFHCLCNRCESPSETQLSKNGIIDGIVCPVEGCSGVMKWKFDDQFVDSESTEDGEEPSILWCCSNEQCTGRREHSELVGRMLSLENLFSQQLIASDYQKMNEEALVQSGEEFMQLAASFLHPSHRLSARTYSNLATFETKCKKRAAGYLNRHIEAVSTVLGDAQPAIIDDMIYLGLLSETHAERASYLARAESIYFKLFGDAGRPFSLHVKGLTGSVCAPRVLFK